MHGITGPDNARDAMMCRRGLALGSSFPAALKVDTKQVNKPPTMRTGHTPHTLASFPVYSSGFLSDNELILGGGGGGGSKSGVKNKLVW
jgi:hypothetical protein